MIEVRELTKRHRDTVAVDHLSFQVRPGQVTGFLGPNGAGKSSTMRLVLGLPPAAALVALLGYAVVAVTAGVVAIRRRDV